MLQSLGSAILSLYGLFIGISGLILLWFLFDRLAEVAMATLEFVTRPLALFAYRNAPDDVIDARSEQALAIAVSAMIIAFFVLIARLISPSF